MDAETVESEDVSPEVPRSRVSAAPEAPQIEVGGRRSTGCGGGPAMVPARQGRPSPSRYDVRSGTDARRIGDERGLAARRLRGPGPRRLDPPAAVGAAGGRAAGPEPSTDLTDAAGGDVVGPTSPTSGRTPACARPRRRGRDPPPTPPCSPGDRRPSRGAERRSARRCGAPPEATSPWIGGDRTPRAHHDAASVKDRRSATRHGR